MIAHDPAVLAQVSAQSGGGGRAGLAQVVQDPLPHRVRQCPQFLDVAHFAGLKCVAHDARIVMHTFLCKYFWARTLARPGGPWPPCSHSWLQSRPAPGSAHAIRRRELARPEKGLAYGRSLRRDVRRRNRPDLHYRTARHQLSRRENGCARRSAGLRDRSRISHLGASRVMGHHRGPTPNRHRYAFRELFAEST